jgi:hypothetical protein
MRALLSFIVSTTSFGLSLWAGVAAAAEPFNWSPQVDDPIHTPAELVESMHSAFGYNHCRAVHAKDDPSIAWPDNRKRVLLGRLEIKRLTANTAEEDRTLVFNPSNVPTGIETADMLSSFYSKAFRLSAKEERDVGPVARN